MNLGKVRVQLTAMFAVLLSVAVVLMAVVAGRSGTSRIYESAEREIDVLMSEAVIEGYNTDEFRFDNAWVVNPVDQWSNPLGNTVVEPPLFAIANDSREAPVYRQFDQNGPWMASARLVDENQFVVIAIDMADFEEDASSLRWRLGLSATALIVLATFGGWKLAGRSLEPARQAMAQQRDFIADAAHELRTPLAIIQASASQALGREREAWEYQRSLGEIQVATERAATGVNSLLELARLESGQAMPRLAPLRLDLLVEEIAASTRLDGVVVEADDVAPVIVNADYALLRQAMANLAANAAARADRVTLRVVADDGWARAEVADNGPGFEPEALDAVFNRFRRGDEKGAAGMGLAIVKTIVDAHHGTVTARNRDEGGAEITVSLKVAG